MASVCHLIFWPKQRYWLDQLDPHIVQQKKLFKILERNGFFLGWNVWPQKIASILQIAKVYIWVYVSQLNSKIVKQTPEYIYKKLFIYIMLSEKLWNEKDLKAAFTSGK
jgi:hypothetical protein